jgi:hypothetical protein
MLAVVLDDIRLCRALPLVCLVFSTCREIRRFLTKAIDRAEFNIIG